MHTYAALLRAVNVGGTGKFPMSDLRAMCERLGFERVRTYIASGNVVFRSALSEAKVTSALEEALQMYAGKPVGVMVRSGPELAAILEANPFSAAPPERTVVVFLDTAPPADTLTNVSGVSREEIALGKREIYVHYRDGIGRSKLKIAAASSGTARNVNTVAKLAEWAME